MPPIVVIDKTATIWRLSKNLWEILPTFPSFCLSLRGIAACWIPSGFVVTGGYCDEHEEKADVHLFIAESMTWKELAPMKYRRCNHSAVFFKNSIYVLGGETNTLASTTSVESYSFDTEQWLQVTNLRMGLLYPYVAVVQDRLYVLGGKTCLDTEMDEVYVLDEHIRFQRLAYMPNALEKGSCTVLGSSIYVVGGESSNMVYNTETNQWTVISGPSQCE
jgi:hypothetical protein